ncbi:2-oxo acid dehydrogenase subunit E2 [Candidatus Halobeggiatoa sp. HSG11]|nr:2-oxo acid dehydrogenase subunit E2 [Candidatus Halobeggiatoa sp. HSG11]
MSNVEIKLPVLAAKSTAKLLNWQKKIGDVVKEGERLIEVETDKVILEVLASQNGKITKLLKENNEYVSGGETIAILEGNNTKFKLPTIPKQLPSSIEVNTATKVSESKISDTENNINLQSDNMQNNIDCKSSLPSRTEERIPMTHSRIQLAKLLLKTQTEHVISTVFDEVNMRNIKDLCAKYKQSFEKQHGTKLEVISFFTKAVVMALKKFPIINTSIINNDIVYHNYYNIGITINNFNVTPILHNADNMSFADIEKNIVDLTKRADNAKLTMEELTGGTFTITNMSSSMLSTPILNSPQNAILGIHNIVERPVAENGQVVIHPMMFVALSYDQRLIDNNEAVQFLVTIKNLLEDPYRLLLEI